MLSVCSLCYSQWKIFFSLETAMEAKMNRARDGVQIFFAVLFWMSLFFWASVWDSDDNKRSRKGGWFKR